MGQSGLTEARDVNVAACARQGGRKGHLSVEIPADYLNGVAVPLELQLDVSFGLFGGELTDDRKAARCFVLLGRFPSG